MPKLTVDGVGEFEVPQGKRLVLALEDEAKIDQLHACGGNARCTTCRVEFVAGEPDQMTAAEKAVLAARGLTGVRLSPSGLFATTTWRSRASSAGWPAAAGKLDVGGTAGRRHHSPAAVGAGTVIGRGRRPAGVRPACSGLALCTAGVELGQPTH